ncbi:phosphate/phosphite/phosphonate ABC transporter substrate-binding protein [Massilia sp. SYSU DXS3249]
MRSTIRAGLALLLALSWASPASASGPVYQFSPVNQYNLKVTAGYWNPILAYVSQKSGVRLNLKIGRTSADTTGFILANQVDFAFTNHLFGPDRVKLGWSVFARRDGAPVHAQIVVPADSTVTSLDQLAGATFAFPGREALLSYLVPYAELQRRRQPVKAVFAGNMDAAFTQLFSGRAQAAGAHSQLVEHYAGRENKRFRVLWSSPPFNDLPLMASSRVPRAQLQAVADAFLGMHRDPQGRKVLAEAAALVHARTPLSFVAAGEADYDDYRRFYSAQSAQSAHGRAALAQR